MHATLTDLGLIGWPKTSGSRGMHVSVRIRQSWAFDEVRRAVSVPVFEGHRVRYVLSMLLFPEALSGILREQKFSPAAIGALYDRRGVAIARTLHPTHVVANSGPTKLVAAMKSDGEGWIRDDTAEGVPAYFAFSRSKLSGWTVSLGRSTWSCR